jgi:hypothetical protein
VLLKNFILQQMDITTGNFRINKLYPLKVWLTTIVLIAPLLLFAGSLILDSSYYKSSDNYFILLLFIGFGLLYSLPTFLLCYLTFIISSHKLNSSLLIKTMFDAVCITGIFITFSLIGGSEATQYSFCYSASVIIASLLFRVFKK